MKKKLFAVLFALSLLSSCGDNSNERQSSANEEGYKFASGLTGEVKEIGFTIEADFGNYQKDKVTYLLGSSLIPFEGYDFIPGDYVSISYKGEWVVNETYPSIIKTELLEIVDINFYKGRVMEATVIEGGDGKKVFLMDGCCIGYSATNFNVILEDGGYRKGDEFEVGGKLYGVNPATFSSLTAVYFFSYNPSPKM